MLYVTGDCHGDFRKFSTKWFPEQNEMSKDDFVIVCGDFGLWHPTKSESYWLDWLNDKPFTTLFVDGNHENFDRLYSDEFETVGFHGGVTHRIRDSVHHLCRGHVFTLCDQTIFAFGGASSHDISGGILDADDYESEEAFHHVVSQYRRRGVQFRIRHLSWWDREMPSREEMDFGLATLEAHHNTVDYVVTHCCPQHVASLFSGGEYKADDLTSYFNTVCDKLTFKRWFFGHYHIDRQIMPQFLAMYDDVVRIA